MSSMAKIKIRRKLLSFSGTARWKDVDVGHECSATPARKQYETERSWVNCFTWKDVRSWCCLTIKSMQETLKCFLNHRETASISQDGPQWLVWMRIRLMIRRLQVRFDDEIICTVILSLPLIQEAQMSVSGKSLCTILVNRLDQEKCG